MSDFPTTNDRAAWAAAAAQVFGEYSRQLDPDYLIEPESVAEIVGDLICDLLHLVRLAGGDPNTILFKGLGHFEDELAGDAAEQLEARSRYLGFAHLGGDQWEVMVLDSLTEARNEFARLAARPRDAITGHTVMRLYRSMSPDPDPDDEPAVGGGFVAMEYRLTATPDGARIERV